MLIKFPEKLRICVAEEAVLALRVAPFRTKISPRIVSVLAVPLLPISNDPLTLCPIVKFLHCALTSIVITWPSKIITSSPKPGIPPGPVQVPAVFHLPDATAEVYVPPARVG